MIGPAFEACREMQYLPSGAGELTRRRSLTQLVGDFSVILGAGCRWSRDCEPGGGGNL